MASWTIPVCIAYRKEWYDVDLTYDGPSCYMLGTGGPLGGNLEWHYVGHTVNERRRMCQYGRDGSHLSRIINYHLNQEWHLWYRAISCGSKEAAGIMERAYLKKYIFDWNYLLNSG